MPIMTTGIIVIIKTLFHRPEPAGHHKGDGLLFSGQGFAGTFSPNSPALPVAV